MKKILMSLCLLSAGSFLCAQDMHSSTRNRTSVPDVVMTSFHHDYPDANAVHWYMKDGKWDAKFHKMDGNVAMTSCYDVKGRRIDSRMPVAQTAVPLKVMHRLNDKYAGIYSHSFTRIERPSKRELYQVKVKEQGKYKTLYLDKKGHERDYASR